MAIHAVLDIRTFRQLVFSSLHAVVLAGPTRGTARLWCGQDRSRRGLCPRLLRGRGARLLLLASIVLQTIRRNVRRSTHMSVRHLPGHGVSDVLSVAQDMRTIQDSALRLVSRYLLRHAVADHQ